MDSAYTFVLDRQRLRWLAEKHRTAYQDAKPFPHIVIDDFLPAEVTEVLSAFPAPKGVPGERLKINGKEAGAAEICLDAVAVELLKEVRLV